MKKYNDANLDASQHNVISGNEPSSEMAKVKNWNGPKQVKSYLNLKPLKVVSQSEYPYPQ